MEVKASLKHLRMSSQKARLVIDIVRKMPVDKALDQLRFANKLAATPISKLIKSAIANAVNNFSLEADNLYIKEMKADEGVTLKRWMPRAHGRATSIRKRGCHIDLVLAEIKESGKKEKKQVKLAEPVRLEKLAKDGEKVLKNKEDKKSAKDKTLPVGEKIKDVADSRSEGHHGPAKGDGGKGFAGKMFRRKAG